MLWIEAIALAAARATLGGTSLPQAGQQRHRFLVAARLDDGDGFELFDLGCVGLVEQDRGAGLGEGRLGGLVGFLGERAVDHGKRALVMALEHRLRGRDPLGGIGRQQRQAAERCLHGAAQAVVETDGGGTVRQLVDRGAGGGVDDLAVGARYENLLGLRIGRQPSVLQRADDGKGQRIARGGDHADRLVGVGKIVIGEFGDRILERARQRRHGEGCGQEDCEQGRANTVEEIGRHNTTPAGVWGEGGGSAAFSGLLSSW